MNTNRTISFTMRAAMMLLTVLFTVFAPITPAWAVEVTIGNGSYGSRILPFNTWFKYSLTQQIYTAEEIGVAGTINSIAFDYLRMQDFSVSGFKVYMKHITKPSFSSSYEMVAISDNDKVFDGTYKSKSYPWRGWTAITLSKPFKYDGQSNLLVCIYAPTNGGLGTSDNSFHYTQTTRYMSITYYDDDIVPDLNNLSSYSGNHDLAKGRANIRFDITPASGSVATPTTFSVSNVTGHEATLTWTEGNNTYNVEYKKTADTEWTRAGSNITAKSLRLTGLQDETAYEARVQSVGDGGATSKWRTARFTTPIAVPVPTGLTVNDYTHTTANLSWTENGNATSWQICLNNDETRLIDVSGSPAYTLTDLTPLTTYTVKVRAAGVGEYSKWTQGVSFGTTGVPEAVGDSWSDDFEGTTCSWQLINGNLTNAWVWGTAAHNGSGTHALYISNNGGTSNAYSNNSSKVFAAKLLSFTDGKYIFSYDWQANGEATYDFLRVALVPASQKLTAGTDYSTIGTNSLPAGWIALDGGNKLNEVSEWQNKEVTINVTEGRYYLVFVWRNDHTKNYNPSAAIDNVSIARMTCPYVVEGLAVSNISTTGATLTWTAGEATQWQISYSTNSSFDNATEVITDAPSYNLTGMTPETIYHARVRSYCGDSDFGQWSDAVSFEPTTKTVVGLGTKTNQNVPTNTYYNNSLTEQIYTVAELGTTPNDILSIDFYCSSKNSTRELDIYMVNTTKNSFENSADWVSVTAADLVFSGEVTFREKAWKTIELDKPFAYNGQSNVVLVIDDNTSTYSSSFSNFYVFDAPAQAIYGCNDYINYAPTTSLNNYTGNVMNVKNQIRLLMGKTSSFLKPSNLKISSVTHNSASLSWTENGNATAWQICLNNDETNLIAVSGSPAYTFTSLNHLTAYTVKVRAVATGVHSEWSKSVSFETIGVPDAVGNSWSDDFEGATCGWQLINGNLTNAWVWGTAAHNGSGTHALYISDNGGTSNAYSNSGSKVFAAKLLNFTNGKYIFSYDWQANGEATYDFLRVALVPSSQTLTAGTDYSTIGTSSLPAGWIALDGGSKLSRVSEWQNKEVVINVTEGIYYLVLVWRNDNSTNNNPSAAIDNVSITRVTCPYDIEGLAVSNISTSGATLTWTAGEATQWQVSYSTNSNFDNATETIVSAATCNLTGLQSSSHYYARVRSYCGGNDYGFWSDPLQFNTDCGTITSFPWSEDFEGYAYGNFVAPCWVNEHISGDGSYLFRIYTYSSGGNSTHQLQLPDQKAGTQTKLRLPEMALPGSDYEFVIDVYRDSYTYDDKYQTEGIRVYASANGEIEGATELAFIPRNCQVCSQVIPTEAESGWFTYELPIPMSGTCYIILRGESQYNHATYMDNFTVKKIPTCLVPQAVTVSAPYGHGATLSWTLKDNSQTMWDVEVATKEDFSEGVQLFENINKHDNYVLSGLNSETTYYVHVRAKCTVSDVSEWSKSVAFTTTIACPVPTGLAATPDNFSATLNWSGSSDSYNISYRTAAYNDGLIEAFNSSTIPAGWTRYEGLFDYNNTGNLNPSNYGWATNSNALGQYNMKLNIYGSNCKNWLISPEFTPRQDLSFDLALTKYNTSNPIQDNSLQADDRFIVLIYDNDTWHILREWNNSGSQEVYNNIPATGKQVTIPLSTYYGKKVKIAFYGESTLYSDDNAGDNDLHIDNVVCGIPHEAGEWQTAAANGSPFTITGLSPGTLYEAKIQGNYGEEGLSQESPVITFTTLDANPVPTDVTVSNITPTAATLSWTGYGDRYNVRYKATNSDGDWETAITNDNTIILSALISTKESGTTYEFQVQSVKEGKEDSDWTEIATFTTLRLSNHALTGNNVMFFDERNEIHEATAGQTVIVSLSPDNIPDGQYMTGAYLSDDVVITLGDVGDGTFVMPAKAVTVTAELSERTPYIIDLTRNTTQVIPEDAYLALMLQEGYSTSVYDQASGNYLWCVDLNRDGTPDLQLTEDEEAETATYGVQRLEGAKDVTVNCRFIIRTYVGINPSPYSTVLVKLDNDYPEEDQPMLEMLDDDCDNSSTITEWAREGNSRNVIITRRTLHRDGSWNTLCLPFNVTINGSVLDGAEARALSSASISGKTLNLTFDNKADMLEAGVPYIIRWNEAAPDIVEPVFMGVTIPDFSTYAGNNDEKNLEAFLADKSYDTAAKGVTTAERVCYNGQYGTISFFDGYNDEDNPSAREDDLNKYYKKYLLLDGNELYYPQPTLANPTKEWDGENEKHFPTLGAFRSYIRIGNDGVEPTVRPNAYSINFGDGNVITGKLADIGDVNGDGQITITDATLVMEYLNTGTMPVGFVRRAADTNGDGQVTYIDAVSILHWILN